MSHLILEISDTSDSIDRLIDRLLEHAECHEHVAAQDDEQRQWAADLRSAAQEIKRLRAVVSEQPVAEPVMANGLTEAETNDTASVAGLSPVAESFDEAACRESCDICIGENGVP